VAGSPQACELVVAVRTLQAGKGQMAAVVALSPAALLPSVPLEAAASPPF